MMQNELYETALKYFNEEYGNVLPGNVSIEEFTKSNLDYKNRGKVLFDILNQIVQIKKNDKILDFGTGTGNIPFYLKENGFNAEGYEIDPRLYNILKIALDHVNNNVKPTFYYSTDGKVPVSDNTYDLIYSYFVLEHVEDIKGYIQEALRISKKGGKIIVYTCNYLLSYEYHYQLFLPIISKTLCKIILKLNGRNINFIDHLKFVTPRIIEKALKEIRKTNDIGIVNYGIDDFMKNVDNHERHSAIFLKTTYLFRKTGLIKYLRKFGFYNPIIYIITKK